MNFKSRILITGLFILWQLIEWTKYSDPQNPAIWVHVSIATLWYILGLIFIIIGITKSKDE